MPINHTVCVPYSYPESLNGCLSQGKMKIVQMLRVDLRIKLQSLTSLLKSAIILELSHHL